MEQKVKKRKRDVESNDSCDYFAGHFELARDESVLQKFQIKETSAHCLPTVGNIIHVSTTGGEEKISFEQISSSDVKNNVKKLLLNNWKKVSTDISDFTPIQTDVYNVISKYVDFYYPGQSLKNLHELRPVYVLHALNHVLKSRQKVLRNNALLKQMKEEEKLKKKNKNKKQGNVVESCKRLANDDEDDEKYRDQGFTRPRVIILTPFRHGALKIVEIISKLLFGDKEKAHVKNRQRFYDEYGSEEAETDSDKPRFPRPDDYKELFTGNVDDCFRIGLSVAKKSLKLYAEFYKSDIIIASPLGVRSATGTVDDKDFDTDFLSSVELLIMEQTDVFLMQNWSHVAHVMENINKRPKKSRDTDFSRVRSWSLNDLSAFYRQTLLFSSINTPEMKNIFSKFCQNFDGFVYLSNQTQFGVLSEIHVEIPQAFYRFVCDSLETEADCRLEFFHKKILPQYKNNSSTLRRTLIYVSSYFDFVRLRNLMKKEDCSFVQVCEYTDDRKVSRARDLFYHEKKQFLLFTERFHFYKRYSIRGIRNLIFYQLPVYAKFYSEICNMLEDQRDAASQLTCSVIYSKFDALRLAAVVGSDKARTLLDSDKSLHMIVSKN